MSNSAQVLVKNLAAQVISTVARLGSLALVPILIARYWGPQVYGRFTALIAFVTIFKFAIDWGIDNLAVREIARDKTHVHRFVSASLYIILVSSTLTVLAIFALNQLTHIADGYLGLLLMACLWIVFEVVGLFFSGVFYAYEKMEYDTVTVLADALTALLLTTVLILSGMKSLSALMACLVISRLVNVTVSIWIYLRWCSDPPRASGFDFRPQWATAKQIFITAIPFGLQILLVQSSNFLIVFLSHAHGDEATGLFKAAQSLIIFTAVLGTLVSNVLYPRISKAYSESLTTFAQILGNAIHYLLALGLPLAVIFFILSDPIIRLVYGSGYQSSSYYLRLLAINIPIMFLNNILATAATSSDRQPARTAVLALTTLFSIGLGLWWIPPYGAVGACLALLVARLAGLILYGILTARGYGWPYSLMRSFPVLLATCVLAVFLAAMGSRPLWIILPGAIALYGIVLFSLDRSLRQDIQRLQFLVLLQTSWGATRRLFLKSVEKENGDLQG